MLNLLTVFSFVIFDNAIGLDSPLAANGPKSPTMLYFFFEIGISLFPFPVTCHHYDEE